MNKNLIEINDLKELLNKYQLDLDKTMKQIDIYHNLNDTSNIRISRKKLKDICKIMWYLEERIYKLEQN